MNRLRRAACRSFRGRAAHLMRMPAKSTVDKAAESAELDRIALPMIERGMHIDVAYSTAMQEVLRALSTQQPPARSGATPAASSRGALLPLFEQE